MSHNSILTEAEDIVGGQRRIDYGPCTESFEVIADMWNTYLAGRTARLNGQDVAMLMALLKICRYRVSGTRDSLVDLAGYAECASQIDDDYAEQRRAARVDEAAWDEQLTRFEEKVRLNNSYGVAATSWHADSMRGDAGDM